MVPMWMFELVPVFPLSDAYIKGGTMLNQGPGLQWGRFKGIQVGTEMGAEGIG